VVQARRVLERRAHNGGDHHRRIRLGEALDELAAPGARHPVPQAFEDLAHGGAPAVGGARREGGVDEIAQAPVVLAVEVQDVAADLLGQRSLVDLEDLGDLESREGGRAGAQEELARLAVEHGVAEGNLRQPPLRSQAGQHVVEARAAQGGVVVGQDGRVELVDRGDCRCAHRTILIRRPGLR